MALTWNRYGKSRVRLVQVGRDGGPHSLRDLTIDVQLEGNFDSVYIDGDNATCLATDTMKNTVYAYARTEPIAQLEHFADRLATHFLEQPQVERARVVIAEQRWDRIAVAGQPHPHAFQQPGGEQWTAVVVRDARGLEVSGGLTGLVLLKTTDSAFVGFPRDGYTTLQETTDRIFATSVAASWRYQPDVSHFDDRDRIRQAIIETFATHESHSVQHTLYALAQAALAASADISDITLSLPNRHHLLVDLSPFGLENRHEIFVATDQPFGLIEATVSRD